MYFKLLTVLLKTESNGKSKFVKMYDESLYVAVKLSESELSEAQS